ncbi:MAG: shikimate kinase [Flavobacteriales bacterium]
MPIGKSIFLTGFMGSGKSTIGKLLAANLQLEFIDLDEYIESETGNSISKIFASAGENEFRKIEHDCLLQLVSTGTKKVVALGGGTVCYNDSIDRIKEKGLLVYLKADTDILYERLQKTSDTRPLLQKLKGNALRDFITTKLAEREVYYNQANFIVDGNQSAENVAGSITTWLTK